MRAVDKPVVIMTEKRRVKPTTRLKEAMAEMAGHGRGRVAAQGEEEEDGEGAAAAERYGMRRRKKTKVEQEEQDGATGEREEERAERNVLAAAAAAVAAPPPDRAAAAAAAATAAAPAVEEEKERTDPELQSRRGFGPVGPPPEPEGPQLSPTQIWEQSERARLLQQIQEQEVFVVERGPAPRVDRVEYGVRPSDARSQMDFVCQMEGGKRLVQVTKQQVLEHPEGLNVLLDFYEKHIVISAKLSVLKKKNNSAP